MCLFWGQLIIYFIVTSHVNWTNLCMKMDRFVVLSNKGYKVKMLCVLLVLKGVFIIN